MVALGGLVFLLAVLTPGAQRQTHIVQGHVDLESTNSLQPILVQLETSGGGRVGSTYANPAGNFVLGNVAEGAYNVIVQVDGFETARERITVPGFGSDVWISMRPRLRQRPFEDEAGLGSPHLVDARQLRIPKSAVREYQKALDAVKEGKTDRAVKGLERAIRITPEFYEAVTELGKIFVDRMEYESAIDVFRSARPAALDGAAASFYYGYSLYRTGEYEAAEKALLHSLTLDSAMPAAHLVLANIFIKRREFEKALHQIDTYLEGTPANPNRADAEEKRAALIRLLEK